MTANPRNPEPLSPSADPFPVHSGDLSKYEVREELARGGQGRVLSAYDRRLRRTVALKELLGTNDEAAARFEREALITARLQHPSIVNVHEAGRWPDGKPFYAMKLVEGKPLGVVIAETPSFAERLRLLPRIIHISEALAYAHSQKIIHRDLKPANVLVGSYGETVVIDWGLAKDLTRLDEPDSRSLVMEAIAEDEDSASTSDSGSDHTMDSSGGGITVAGGILGTPAFMSPEQARGDPADERSDVYSLGSILYTLLAGKPPYEAPNARVVIDMVLREDPLPLAKRQAGIPKDLQDIVEKAMSRDPAKRYADAGALSKELTRFETGQLVAAHTYTTWELVQRWVRRYRAAVAVGALSLVLLAAIGTLSVQRIMRERDAAEVARSRADARADEITLVQARSWIDRSPVRALAWLKGLSPGSDRWPAARLLAEECRDAGVHHVLEGHEGRVWHAAFSPDGRLIASAGDDRTVRIWDLANRRATVLHGHPGLVKHAIFSPDGARLATSGQEGSVIVWDVARGQGRPLVGHRDFVRRLAFFPSGDGLASAGSDSVVRVWDLVTGMSRTFVAESALEDVAVSPRGDALATVERAGVVRLWDLGTGEGKIVARTSGPLEHVAFSPGGDVLAAAGGDSVLLLWDRASESLRILAGDPSVTRVAFSPGGDTLATASFNGNVRLRNLLTGESRVFASGGVLGLAFDPEGKTLASAGLDGSVGVRDLSTGVERVFNGHEDWVLHVEFSHDGKSLVSCGADGTLRVWSLADPGWVVRAEPGREMASVTFSPDGSRLAFHGPETIHVRDASGEVRDLEGHAGGVRDVAFSPNGTLLASGGGDRMVRVRDLERGDARTLSGHDGGVEAVIFSPDGSDLASASIDNTVRIWKVATGECRVLRGHAAKVSHLAYSPDGRRLASASSDSTVRIWDTATGEGRSYSGHNGWVWRVAFSPDGRVVASCGADGDVRIWDPESGNARVFSGHEGWVRSLAFSEDGETLVSGGQDGAVRVWTLASGESRVFRGHTGEIMQVTCSTDGRTAASAGSDGEIRLWDIPSGVFRRIRGHGGAVTGVAFAPGGGILASSSLDGSVRLWQDDLPGDSGGLKAWLDSATNAVLGRSDSEVRYPWGASSESP